jgi:ABC-type transporter Mla subunit MlaD
MRVRRIALMMVAKFAVALALMPPTTRDGAVEYRTSVPLPGLEPGAPVVLAGVLIGHVSQVSRRGDATVLHLRFTRDAKQLPGSRVVRLRPFGLEGAVALEMLMGPDGTTRSFERGGLLDVRPWEPEPPKPPSMPHWNPYATPARRSRPHTSA